MSPLCPPPGQFFNPICCFLLFNVMDCLGRSLTSYFLWVSTSTGVISHLEKQSGIRECERARKGDFPTLTGPGLGLVTEQPVSTEHQPLEACKSGLGLNSLKAEAMSS